MHTEFKLVLGMKKMVLLKKVWNNNNILLNQFYDDYESDFWKAVKPKRSKNVSLWGRTFLHELLLKVATDRDVEDLKTRLFAEKNCCPFLYNA